MRTVVPFVTIYAAPRSILIIASVTIKGDSVVREIIKPFTAPKHMPSSRVAIMPIAKGIDEFAKLPPTTPITAITEPTLKSIPPDIIISVMPVAKKKFEEICRNTLRIFL